MSHLILKLTTFIKAFIKPAMSSTSAINKIPSIFSQDNIDLHPHRLYNDYNSMIIPDGKITLKTKLYRDKEVCT